MAACVTVYHREGCHLCDRMFAELRSLQRRLDFHVQPVDIDEDPQLKERFNVKVPVLAVEDEILCCHFLDVPGLERALEPD
ncbi:glutaredoxin [Ectothiorhodospira haloalkaliphila]|uniref:Glutaredoxin n=1 Tax=Ectothiorhodospira haloalkaliphila TaxID=421628 RepID=W8KFY9_9GAMM|nr:glutaredoxin family protein [Ectothiorhodospira haloalkaliphila]AHK78669.1 glutaredoxin [Ectothiorhodospira haloalkaliphila]MCG5524663.1 glutaredoxin family protein [Ectothiorhodospira haloalkaliphila]